jgi:hypothetical protein
MFATNVAFNLFWEWVGDPVGWRETITFVGSCGCALSTLGLYYVPHIFGASYILVLLAGTAYGAALAGFVPIGRLVNIVPLLNDIDVSKRDSYTLSLAT